MAEWKAHDPHIILKIEAQYVKNELFVSFNPIQINIPFLYPMKKKKKNEKNRFFDVFSRYGNRTLVWNWLR